MNRLFLTNYSRMKSFQTRNRRAEEVQTVLAVSHAGAILSFFASLHLILFENQNDRLLSLLAYHQVCLRRLASSNFDFH